ncbi:DNA replication/repair protein RecF [Neptunicella marina]|uniref:DNA replication and repair protein RecF n=1 Tax=Neptunicella marina TaxID=2125989 RepID=A0A8J6ITZ0_9ALTE|nr:DNA replication/repair protein RecF [Neptunicella marina]MBC3766636.1 DNA replication/repair protein RecF [Neptunicella marina]
MQLDKVQIQYFRNIESASFQPCNNLNLFIGKNGSGKTSLLEALHYLSCGRSFRTNKFQHLIQHNHERFTLFGLLTSFNAEMERPINSKIGISRNVAGVVDLKLNGDKQSRISAIAQLMPSLVFTPQSTELITGSPQVRRNFVDWGVFHVEHNYLKQISAFAKLLKHRNAILKASKFGHKQDIEYWNKQFCVVGEIVSSARKEYLDALRPYFSEQLTQFLPEFSIEIAYYKGWERELDLASLLSKNESKDNIYGYTTSGPHKADLKLSVNSKPVQEILSRGQLRLLASALKIAQSRLLYDKRNINCIYLLDDIGAELDANKRQLFANHLIETNAQVFITATDMSHIDFLDNFSSKKVFHVEHGQVNEEK